MARLVEFKTVTGSVWIAVAHIVAVREGDTGGTTILLVNGEIHCTENLKIVRGRI